MVLVLVVGSAVQKKRGHQRGVTREGQQQSKKSCLCVSILFSQATKWKVELYEILYPIRIHPMHDYIG